MKITGKLRKIGDIPVIVQKETVHITERKDEPFNLAEFANKLLEDENWRKNLFKPLINLIKQKKSFISETLFCVGR